MIAEGDALIDAALRAGQPGPYQLHAAIAACHSVAPSAEATDWHQIAALYGELIRFEATPVVEANRAIAVAMAEGPAAGLVILDAVTHHPQLARWPEIHIARGGLLARLGRTQMHLTPTRPLSSLNHRRHNGGLSKAASRSSPKGDASTVPVDQKRP